MGDLDEQDNKVEEENEKLLEKGVMVLDFDVLCSSVAMKASQGKWGKLRTMEEEEEEEEENEVYGGVLRMWESELLDGFYHRRIALESIFCPCYRFGKNMKRAGYGSCYIQATIYLILAICAFVNFIAFVVTKRHCFLYVAVSFIVFVSAYLGFFRTLIRKRFNIMGSESSLDDCVYHFACPCCTLCQESITLEMNNVQDGTWHGRGDTKCIDGFGEKSRAHFELLPPSLVSIKSFNESCIETKINVINHPS